jgi:hypothetical protein
MLFPRQNSDHVWSAAHAEVSEASFAIRCAEEHGHL